MLPLLLGLVVFAAAPPSGDRAPVAQPANPSTTTGTTTVPALATIGSPDTTRAVEPATTAPSATVTTASPITTTLDPSLASATTTSVPETTSTTEPPSPTVVEPVVRIAVLGDVGTGDEKEWATAESAAKAGAADPFDALILLGDNVYPNGDPGRLDATVFEPFAPLLDDGAKLLPVLGNHDVKDGHGDAQVARLGMPGRWYATRVGPVLVVSLDSTRVEDEAQTAWLEATLAGATSNFVIVSMHHPAYSAGHHGSTGKVQRHWVPLFEEYGVDLALAGHDHDYQRSRPIDGIVYVVSGGAAKLRPTGTAEFTAYSASVLHFVALDVYRDRIELTAIGHDGAFDEAVVARR